MKDNQAKYPQLRFKGFTDPWEERKLSAAVDNIGTGKSKYMLQEKSDLAKYEVLGSTSVIGYDEDYDHEGDFILTARVGANAGNLYHHSGKVKITDNTVFIQGKNLAFIYNLLTQFNLKKLSFGTGQPLVKASELKNLILYFPNNDEQAKIGSYFKQLDHLITLHQRKLDLLKEQKKGYLQKMFPKNGAKVPKLRFAGFADDWEERKLSDVANHRGGTAIEKYFDKDGVYKVISIGSYGLNSQYVDQNIRAISNEITDGRVVNSGELTMVLNDKTANGSIIGRTLLVEKDNEYVINQRTEIISPKENFDSNFAYTILNGPFREKVKRIVQGGTQIYVNYPAVSNLDLELPKIEEQQKIGSFFKQLDDTIALHQRKLDLLKEQKKGFLQKMFV